MANFLVIHVGRAASVAEARANLVERMGALTGGDYLDLDCAWLVESDETADEIRDKLKPSLPREDGLLVFGLSEQAAWSGLREEQADWFLEHL
jgi:hypothetical protein